MKLIEFLGTLEPDKPIKIGAKDGSSFFYLGNPADMLLTFDTSCKRYGEYDMIIYKSYETAIKRIETQLSVLYSNAIKYAQEHDAEITAKGFRKALQIIFKSDMAKKIIKVEDKLTETIDHQRKTKSMQDREVLDYFKADEIVDEGTIAIIVEGFEYGRYWTYDEANTGLGGKLKPSIKLNNNVEGAK